MPVQSTQRKPEKQLTDIEIAKALGCSKAGAHQRTIAEWLKATKSSVQRALSTYSFDTFQGRNLRREYHRITTEREDRYIQRALKQNSDLPLKDITNIINAPISTTTLRRRRSEAGLGSFVAVEKPGLRPENMKARLAWAQRYKDWTVDDWKRVIWSDESSIWIGVNPRRRWVIRPPGERLNPKYVKPTYKTAQVKVMVWACFTGGRVGPLIVCDEGGIGANEYEDILHDGLVFSTR
jgi:Transposase